MPKDDANEEQEDPKPLKQAEPKPAGTADETRGSDAADGADAEPPTMPPCAEETTITDDKGESRRAFVAKAGSVCAGCVLVGIPIAAAIPVIIDPLNEGGTGEADFLRVASLDALPDDGTPLLVTVRADKQDAWSRFPNRAIGAIYLRKLPKGKLQAINVVCPHLGCAVEFREEQKDYFCKCHDSAFGFENGEREDGSPSARDLDTLEVEVRKDNHVWVQFQNFQTGKKEKVPV